MNFQDKHVLVTGASSGIGRETALQFAKAGASVIAVARRKERLDELAAEAETTSGKIIPLQADLMQKEGPEKMMQEVFEIFDGLDILVNNAGIMDDMSGVASITDEMYERIFAVNVRAPMLSMKIAVNHFLERGGGVIVNVASVAGLEGTRAGAIYTASKHAVVGLTKNTAYMYNNEGVRCNAVCPGGVETEVGAGEFMKNINQADVAKVYAAMGDRVRMGKPEELASVILFLASEEASFLSGAAIPVDAGWTAY